jgi:hypothetical protein
LELKTNFTAEQVDGALCLPTKPIQSNVGKMATIMGWGMMMNESYATHLQSLNVKLLPDCMKTIKTEE